MAKRCIWSLALLLLCSLDGLSQATKNSTSAPAPKEIQIGLVDNSKSKYQEGCGCSFWPVGKEPKTDQPNTWQFIQMPTFTLKGNLVHFAAYKNHIGLYPVPRGVEEFKNRLSAYAGEKSTLRLPLDKPIPTALIRDIVKFLVKKNLDAGETKRTKR